MSDTTELIFEEPPPILPPAGFRTPGQTPFGRWLNELQRHPGVWAKYPVRMHKSTPGRVKRGDGFGVAPGEYECKGRNGTSGPGQNDCDLYARYVGPVES